MTRRDLIQKIVVGGAIILVTPAILTDCKKIETPGPAPTPNPVGGSGNTLTIDLSQAANAALNSDGGSMIKQGIIVANTGGGIFVALSSVCTHQGCTVDYSHANHNFPCPCHGSVFSTNGSVVNGPAPTALKSYAISKVGSILTITL
jgi:cytochrome b6-f complex iron-sulfur subunit